MRGNTISQSSNTNLEAEWSQMLFEGATQMHDVIRLENVYTTYEGEKRPAIRNMNLTVNSNEFIYVVGPNAAGKTTLLETINGLLPPSRGKVYVFGQDVRKNGRKVRCQIGYVPQDFIVDPGEPYTALDVVLMGMYGKIGILRKPDRRDLNKATRIMKLLGVDELANRPMGKLSGGQQQKMMIARALAKEPKLLLLDEPFSNLDIDSRQRIPSFIERLHEENGMTIIIVTHNISEISKRCERIVAMDNGEKITDEKLMERPFLLKELYQILGMEVSSRYGLS